MKRVIELILILLEFAVKFQSQLLRVLDIFLAKDQNVTLACVI